jgi:nitrate reductase NapD
MSGTVHISSMLIRCRPDRQQIVSAAILAIPATEIALSDPGGKIIVTMETGSEGEIADALVKIQLFEGVASAALVFHQTDAPPEGATA